MVSKQERFERNLIFIDDVTKYYEPSTELVSLRDTQYKILQKHAKHLNKKENTIISLLQKRASIGEICAFLHICNKSYYNILKSIARKIKKRLIFF